jgi:hypothetical protein
VASAAQGRRLPPSDRLTVLVLGYLVRGPIGGMAWHHLHYVLGLHELGHDVWFLEDSGDSELCCYDPRRGMGSDPTYGLEFASATFGRVGLGERWAYWDAHSARWRGPAASRAPALFARADVLLNVSGANLLRPWALDTPERVLVDTDPAFTQIRNLTDAASRAQTMLHTSFFSFGENIAGGRSTVPDDGLRWKPTRQPIALSAWPARPPAPRGRFTTVMQWSSYPVLEHAGRRYGMKRESFAAIADLPRRTAGELEIALGSPDAPREELRSRGWQVSNPLEVALDPWSYQGFIAASKAELSVAKQGYVISRCGWFSERSAAYLASGRPVVVEETGFSDWLAGGEGVVPFSNLEQAAAAVASVDGHLDRHSTAARAVCEEYFESGKVLSRLLEESLSGETRRKPVEATS